MKTTNPASQKQAPCCCVFCCNKKAMFPKRRSLVSGGCFLLSFYSALMRIEMCELTSRQLSRAGCWMDYRIFKDSVGCSQQFSVPHIPAGQGLDRPRNIPHPELRTSQFTLLHVSLIRSNFASPTGDTLQIIWRGGNHSRQDGWPGLKLKARIRKEWGILKRKWQDKAEVQNAKENKLNFILSLSSSFQHYKIQ